ncbi:hypothetical protein OK344_08095 [Kaistella sp. BT6-1-3]|uniref:Uncharacterized protein n=1 Tax=Kaistella yananensis TaxID=2989820 RepID=A0ABT3JN04_9FLAO|nr:hypothetical protein [Kaistella yananensis]MCW4452168.1 hypothetical protein [Kaistella yananensis]
MDNLNLLDKLENARLKYKPEKIKLLLIAEAPPDSLNRFFYFENVKEKDFLFLAISEYFYPALKEKFLISHRSEKIKAIILSHLKKDGIFLIDLYELPLSVCYETENKAVEKALAKVDDLVNSKTKIITIKSNVYDALKSKLKKYNHVDVRIPFPSSGQQSNFKVKFDEAMVKASF